MPTTDDLPFIDEHSVPIDADSGIVWDALVRSFRRSSNGAARFARLLGCDPLERSEAFDGRVGESVPGFRVAYADRGRTLALTGRHRFARYALTFEIHDGRLRALTHAAFPGLRGAIYKAAVIRSGAHSVVTRRMLRRITATTSRRTPS
ncbi:MAG: hypothetical protein KDD65_15030 [Bacteroidetes bacterium]|nr:hypothetical protein [Bacteroidota bacterium]